MKVRTFIVAAVTAVSTLGLLAPAANAALCYSATVVVNGDTVVDETACI